MKKLLSVIIIILFISCETGKNKFAQHNIIGSDSQKNRASILLHQYLNGTNVLVVAHRADWRNACENSILAIENAIAMGVDIVEIDLKKTKDNQLILSHDFTLDRTTTGKGKISDYTLAEIKQLFLKDGAGHKTTFKVPTLEEALLVAKGKVLVNLDQSYEYFDEVLPILIKTKTLKQIIVKGYNVPLTKAKEKLGVYYDSVQYMPIISFDKKGYKELFKEVLANKPKALECTFSSDTIPEVKQLLGLSKNGTRIWVNSLWPEHNSGHHDDRALIEPDSVYGWLRSKGVNMIQTDRPQLLISYLKKNK